MHEWKQILRKKVIIVKIWNWGKDLKQISFFSRKLIKYISTTVSKTYLNFMVLMSFKIVFLLQSFTEHLAFRKKAKRPAIEMMYNDKKYLFSFRKQKSES